jgi:hypothetical protein
MADIVVSRELKSLQDELSAAQREQVATPASAATASPSPAELPTEDDERELRDQLRELTSDVTSFFDEAEKGILANPMPIANLFSSPPLKLGAGSPRRRLHENRAPRPQCIY